MPKECDTQDQCNPCTLLGAGKAGTGVLCAVRKDKVELKRFKQQVRTLENMTFEGKMNLSLFSLEKRGRRKTAFKYVKRLLQRGRLLKKNKKKKNCSTSLLGQDK